MKCKSCNKEIGENQNFCKYCGAPVDHNVNANNNNNFTEPNNNTNLEYQNVTNQDTISNIDLNKEQNAQSDIEKTIVDFSKVNSGNASVNINKDAANQDYSNINNQYPNSNNNAQENVNSTNLNNYNQTAQNNLGYSDNNQYGYNNQVNNIDQNNNNQPNNMPNYNNNFGANNPQNQFNQNSNGQIKNNQNSSNQYNGNFGNQPPYYNGKKKSKAPIIIGGVVGGLVIFAILIIVISKMFFGSPASKNEIIEALNGEEIYQLGDSFTIDSDNIKDLEIKDRKTSKENDDKINVSFVIENGKSKITIDGEVDYFYSKKDKKWIYAGLINQKVTDFTTDIDLNEEIRTMLCENDKSIRVNDEYVSTSMITKINNAKLTNGDYGNTELVADMEMNNGINCITGKLNCSITYDANEDSFKSGYAKEVTDIKTTKNDNVDEDALNKSVKTYLSSKSVPLDEEYKVGDRNVYGSSYINGNYISDISLNKYVVDEGKNLIIAEINGTISGGIINKLEFKGNVAIPLDFTKGADDGGNFSITGGEVEKASEEDIQKALIDKRMDMQKLTMTEAMSFAESNRYDGGITTKLINGSLEKDGGKIEVQVELSLDCDSDGNISWKVSDIEKKDSYSYIQF